MKKIFVFTSSNSEAQKHLKDTVEKSIDRDLLSSYLDASVLDKIHKDAGGSNAHSIK